MSSELDKIGKRYKYLAYKHIDLNKCYFCTGVTVDRFLSNRFQVYVTDRDVIDSTGVILETDYMYKVLYIDAYDVIEWGDEIKRRA